VIQKSPSVRIPDSTVSRTRHSIKNDLRHADELAQNENGQYATSAAAHDGSNQSGAQSVAFWQEGDQGLGGRNPHRLAGHLTVRGNDGCAPDDRKVSPRKGRRRIRAHDERESQVLRRPDNVRSHGVRQQSKSDCPCSGKDFRRERQVNRR